jgi:energy-coupling factor transporter ATP-binding protein EcfA2
VTASPGTLGVVPPPEEDPVPNAAPAARARGLRKTFGRVVAVDGVDLDLPSGAIVGMLGPNGSGKTTLIRMLLGLTRPTAGHVELLAAPGTAWPRRCPTSGRSSRDRGSTRSSPGATTCCGPRRPNRGSTATCGRRSTRRSSASGCAVGRRGEVTPHDGATAATRWA